jgi:hypothetical protein
MRRMVPLPIWPVMTWLIGCMSVTATVYMHTCEQCGHDVICNKQAMGLHIYMQVSHVAMKAIQLSSQGKEFTADVIL